MIKKYLLNNLYFGSLYKINLLISPAQRTKAILIFFTTFLNGLLDVLGLAIILPVLYLINDPSKIHTNTYLGWVFETLQFKSDSTFLLFAIIMLVLAFISKNLLGLYLVYLQERFVGHLASSIIEREFSNRLYRSYISHINHNTSNTVQEFTRIPTEFARLLVSSVLLVSTEFFVILLILSFIILYKVDLFVLMGLSLIPTVVILNSMTRRKILEFGNLRNTTLKKIFRGATEAVHSFIDIKLTSGQPYFIGKMLVQLNKQEYATTWLKVLNSIPFRTVETASVMAIGVLYVYVAFLSDDPTKMLPLLVLFASASYRVLPSLNRILTALMVMRSSQYVFDTLKQYTPPLHKHDVVKQSRPFTFENQITVQDVSYSYPGKDTKSLDEVNLVFEKGTAIGLMGESGSGKSTLGKVLLGLLTAQEGNILIDGVPVTEENIGNWYSLLGYVPQDFYLLDISLAENVAFGLSPDKIDYEKVERIIAQVQLSDLTKGLKEGVKSNIGEFGNKLSGGQRQRIAIARALYKEAQILVFDEATSALDNNTEKEIMKTLYGLQNHNLTLIIIAHRITSLEKCDVIYEMSNGKVVSKRSYKELIARIS